MTLPPFLVLAAVAAIAAQISPEGQAIVDQVKAAYAQVDSRQATLPKATTTPEILARLVEVDQAGRVVMMRQHAAMSRLPPEERQAVSKALAGVIMPRDQENVQVLKALIPADGWFKRSRDGDQVTQDAWLIVQHATGDPAFMARVLDRMGELVEQGEVNGPNYALLYDRVALEQGRAQRYGSQITCEAGAPAVQKPIEDYATIDERRRAVGLSETQAQYEARFANMPC